MIAKTLRSMADEIRINLNVSNKYSINEIPSAIIAMNDFRNDTGKYENYVSDYIEYTTTEDIPSSIQNLSLNVRQSHIQEGLFYAKSGLSVINLTYNSKQDIHIHPYAFQQCVSLQEINVTNNKYLFLSDAEQAFWDCSNLTTVNGTIYNNNIANFCFDGCINLQSITLGQHSISSPIQTNIGTQAFNNCTNLSIVNMVDCNYSSSKLNTIVLGTNCFADCCNLQNFTTSKYYLMGITQGAFLGCSSLSELYFGTGSNIESMACCRCINLSHINYVSDNGQVYSDSIGPYEYNNFHNIQQGAFQQCGLLSISINKVNLIYDLAFKSCASLSTVTFNDVTTISSSAFVDNPMLSNIIIKFKIPQLRNSNFINVHSQFSINVESSLYNTIISATNWSNFSSKIYSITE